MKPQNKFKKYAIKLTFNPFLGLSEKKRNREKLKESTIKTYEYILK